MKFLGSGLVLFLALLCFAGNVQATNIDLLTAEQIVGRANLIFEGVVTKVAYRHSDVDSNDQERLPYTFVTYRIERLYKGQSEEKNTITLRFQGGPVGDGQILF